MSERTRDWIDPARRKLQSAVYVRSSGSVEIFSLDIESVRTRFAEAARNRGLGMLMSYQCGCSARSLAAIFSPEAMRMC